MEENLWWVSILVAVIGVIGTLIVTNIQLKKDSKTTGDIKSDTGEMKPQVSATALDTKKIREVVVEEIYPKFKGNNTFMDKIDAIALDVEVRKRLEEQTIRNGIDTQGLVASINAMDSIIKNQQDEISDLKRERANLEYQSNSLKRENEELLYALHEYQQNDRDYGLHL